MNGLTNFGVYTWVLLAMISFMMVSIAALCDLISQQLLKKLILTILVITYGTFFFTILVEIYLKVEVIGKKPNLSPTKM